MVLMKAKNLLKPITAVTTSLVMVLSLGNGIITFADETTSVNVTSQAELQAAIDKAAESGKEMVINVMNDINLTGTSNKTNQITIPQNANVTICSSKGNTYSIKETVAFGYDSSAKHGLIESSGKLTLENIVIDSNEMGRGIVVQAVAGSEVTLGDGCKVINGRENYNSGGGIGVYVVTATRANKGATLNILEGAEISNNVNTGNGGIEASGTGVFLGDYATLNMSGGKISNNTTSGRGSTFNGSYSQYGGGLAIKYATANISGGEISENTAYSGGGGVYMQTSAATLNLSGDAKISNNSASGEGMTSSGETIGGGIYLYDGTVNMEGNAEISGNKAETTISSKLDGCGGGVFIKGGYFNMSGGTISGNTAGFDGADLESDDEETEALYDLYTEGCGGGVFIEGGNISGSDAGIFTMTGGTIEGNNATATRENYYQGNGGGVYIGATNGNGGTNYPDGIGTFKFYGGTVDGNSADKNGADIYMADVIISQTSSVGVSYDSEEITGTMAFSATFEVKNSPSAGEIYLPMPCDGDLGGLESHGESIIKVVDSIKDANLNIVPEELNVKTIIAESSDGYSITKDDIDAFKLNSEDYCLEFDEDNNVVIEESYKGEKTSLADAEITVNDVEYNGQAQTPDVKVVVNGNELINGTDYTLSFGNNTNAGTANVTVKGKKAYTGSVTKTFEIVPLDISQEKIHINDFSDACYSGSEIKPEPVLTMNDEKLVADSDYVTTYFDNTNAGVASVVIEGIGNYKGTVTKTFNIVDKDATIISNETELKDFLEKSAGSTDSKATGVLANDVVLTDVIKTSENIYASLYGNGNIITLEQSAKPSSTAPEKAMIQIEGKSQLELTNLEIDAKYNARAIYVDSEASLEADSNTAIYHAASLTESNVLYGGQAIYNAGTTVFNGIISDSASINRYYGIIYNKGNFTLGSESIIQNVTTSLGGAIYNTAEGTLNMLGGTINNASCGTNGISLGAAITNYGNVVMDGGIITNCSSVASAVYNRGNFVMNGGTITGNKNTNGTAGVGSREHGKSGGAVRMEGADSTYTMNGGEISDNQAIEGGGILVVNGKFTLNAGSICNNYGWDDIVSSTNKTNFGNGGGVFMRGGSFLMNGGSITGNIAGYSRSTGSRETISGYGAGIYLNGGTVSISGGEISGNTGMEDGVNSNGIYFADDPQGISTEDSVLEISGNPVIDDYVYIENGMTIDIPAIIGSASVNLYPEFLDYGTTVAKYAEGVEIKATDASAFKIANENYSDMHFEANAEKGEILVGKVDLSNCTAVLKGGAGENADQYTYTGVAILPEVTVFDAHGNEVTGYLRSADDNTNVGEKTLKISGDGAVSEGEIQLKFTIIAKELEESMISLDSEDYAYTGKEIMPSVTLTYNRKNLTEGTDYTYKVSDNIKKGTGTVTVSAVEGGNYTGTAKKEFAIKTDRNLNVSSELSIEYGNKFAITSTDSDASTAYKYRSSDVLIASVTSAGVITAKGTGTCTITITGASTDEYVGKVTKVTVTVTKGTPTIKTGADSYSKKVGDAAFLLNASTTGDGKLSYKSSNTKVATVSADGKVTAIGTGTAKITISSEETENCNAATKEVTINVAKGSQTISLTSTKTTTITKTVGGKAFSLGAKASGNLTYSSSNKKVVTVSSAGKVKIKGCGKATITVTAAATSNYNSATKKIEIKVVPAKSKVKSAKNSSSKTVTLKWSKSKKASGYQIRYATSKSALKNATFSKTIMGAKNLSTKISGLKKGKTYYFEVRAIYMTSSTTFIASDWSAAKSVKIKK